MNQKSAPAPPLCALADIPETGREVSVTGQDNLRWLMLFNRNGTLTAWQNVCPHQGRSLNWAPNRFLFDDEGRLVCSHHGATFDLRDGRCIDGPCKGALLTRVPVSVSEGLVYLDVDQ